MSGSAQELSARELPNQLGPLYGTYVPMGPNTGQKLTPTGNSQRREVGDLAVWTLSSAKHGNGVQQLRDDQVSTFW